MRVVANNAILIKLKKITIGSVYSKLYYCNILLRKECLIFVDMMFEKKKMAHESSEPTLSLNQMKI